MDKVIERIKDIALNEIRRAFNSDFTSLEEMRTKHSELCNDLSERLDNMSASQLFTPNEFREVRDFIRRKLDEIYNSAWFRTKNKLRENYEF